MHISAMTWRIHRPRVRADYFDPRAFAEALRVGSESPPMTDVEMEYLFMRINQFRPDSMTFRGDDFAFGST